MPEDPWQGVEPERAQLARSIFEAAREIADKDGDGEVADLQSAPPALRALGEGFNRLVSLAAKGELDESDPQSMVDALRLASAALVEERQPEQFKGFRWLTGGEPLGEAGRFQFAPPGTFGTPQGPFLEEGQEGAAHPPVAHYGGEVAVPTGGGGESAVQPTHPRGAPQVPPSSFRTGPSVPGEMPAEPASPPQNLEIPADLQRKFRGNLRKHFQSEIEKLLEHF